MENDENDGFVSAGAFLQRLEAQAPPPARAKRESVAQLNNLADVRNKISLWNRAAVVPTPKAAAAAAQPAPAAAAPLRRKPAGLPAAQPQASKAAGPPRRAGALPSLGAIAEDDAETVGGGTRTVLGPLPFASAVPSPATKQAVAQRRQAVAFPSIMFTAKPEAAEARLPLPGAMRVLPPLPLGAATVQQLAGAAASVARSRGRAEAATEWRQQQVVIEEDEDGVSGSQSSTVLFQGGSAGPAAADPDEVSSASLGGALDLAPTAAAAAAAVAEPACASLDGSAVSSGGVAMLEMEGSRHSVGSGQAPLVEEDAEASLRYLVDRKAQSSEDTAVSTAAALELPEPEFMGAAITPARRQQPVFSAGTPAAPANTPASPGAAGQGFAPVAAAEQTELHSMLSVAAAAVAQALDLSAADVQEQEESAAGSPGPEGSPVPPTPYAATEFDGDDVVMADAEFTPMGTAARRAVPDSSRFRLEAIASAGLALARSPVSPAQPLPAGTLEFSPGLHAVAELPAAEQAAVHDEQPEPAAQQAEAVENAAAAGEASTEEAAACEEAWPVSAAKQAAEEEALAVEEAAVVGGSDPAAEETALHAAPEPAAEAPAAAPAAGQGLWALFKGQLLGTAVAPAPSEEVAPASEFPAAAAPEMPSPLQAAEVAGAAVEEVVADSVAADVELAAPHAGWEAAAEQAAALEPLCLAPQLEPVDLPAAAQEEPAAGAEQAAADMPAAEQDATAAADVPTAAGAAGEQQLAEGEANPASELPAEPQLAASPSIGQLAATEALQLPAAAEEPAGVECPAADSAAPAEAAAEQGMGAEVPSEQPSDAHPAVVQSDAAADVGDGAAMLVAQPWLASSPVPAAAPCLPPAAQLEDDAAFAFASRPRLSLSPGPQPAAAEEPAAAADILAPTSPPGQALPAAEEAAAATDILLPASPPGQALPAAEEAGACEAGGAEQAPPFTPRLRAAEVDAEHPSASPAFAERGEQANAAAGAEPAAAEPSPVAAAPSPSGTPRRQQQEEEEEQAAVASAPAEQEDPAASWQQAAPGPGERGESPTMSDNPLAAAAVRAATATPGVSSAGRFAHSPAVSGALSNISNNPLFAGTPAHPTPPSVNLRAFPGSRSGSQAGPSPASSCPTPASTGIKLAERLHQVAEQLQNPAAPQGLAALATPGSGGGRLLRTPTTKFEFAEDVAALLQALEGRTPATTARQLPALGRAAAAATTVQRRGPSQGQQCFAAASGRPSLGAHGGGSSLLDLDGFDANGNRSAAAATTLGATPLLRPQLLGGRTPALVAAPPGGEAADHAAAEGEAGAGPQMATPGEVVALREEAAVLRGQVEEMASQRRDMVELLSGYQHSIADLQDKHSALVVKLRNENSLLKSEVERAQGARSDTERQFHALYHTKYVPLKAQAAEMRRDAGSLQKRLLGEELRAEKAGKEAQAARQELSAAQEQARQLRAALQEQAAHAAAARQAAEQAEQRLQAEGRRGEKALAAQGAALEELQERHSSLTRQYDEAVHRTHIAKQARERALAEVQRREEEACDLEVRLKQLEGVLLEYKRENSKFFEAKERYKRTIAQLDGAVQAKEEEKAQLLAMCTELMTRLEKEGLTLD